jgi:hypothetical protein
MAEVQAPFTPDQVAALNDFQKSPHFHPFTCGSGNRTDVAHLDGEGILVATVEGWLCPFCDYRQSWAHEFMADPKTADSIKRLAALRTEGS